MPLDPVTAPDAGWSSLSEFVTDDRVVHALQATHRDLRLDALEPDAAERLRLARICELLELTGAETLLHAGRATVLQAAVLARLACWVVVVSPDTGRFERRLRDVGATNVTVVQDDPRNGFRDGAPYDAIAISHAGEADALRSALAGQLAAGGRLVAPSPGAPDQILVSRGTPPATCVVSLLAHPYG